MEILMECLRHMPIADLARMMATSKVFRLLAAREIRAQVKRVVEDWVGDYDAFFGLLEVRL